MRSELAQIVSCALSLACSFVVEGHAAGETQRPEFAQQEAAEEKTDGYEKLINELRSAEENGTLSVVAEGASQRVEDYEDVRFLATSIPHNQVQTFPQNADSLSLTFQPLLKASGGCVPFPAVQANGDWNGGLESSGSASGGCTSSSGQVYSRVYTVSAEDQNSGARCAIIYSWYFPKDGNVASGHRHDWENVVVWTNGCDSNANAIAIAYSGHGSYKVHRVTQGSPNGFDGKRVKVKYGQTFPINFQMFPTFDQGGSQPLIGWSQLTNEARNSLNTVDWGKANMPSSDANGLSNVYKAKFW